MYHMMKPDITIVQDAPVSGRLGTEATEFDEVQLGFIPGMGGSKGPPCRGLPNFGVLPQSNVFGLPSFMLASTIKKGGGLKGFAERLLHAAKNPAPYGRIGIFDDQFAFNINQVKRHISKVDPIGKLGLYKMRTKYKETLLTGRLNNISDSVKQSTDDVEYIQNRLQAMANWANSGGPTCQKDVTRIMRMIKTWTKRAKGIVEQVKKDDKTFRNILEKVKEGEQAIDIDLYQPPVEYKQGWVRRAGVSDRTLPWSKRMREIKVLVSPEVPVYEEGVGWKAIRVTASDPKLTMLYSSSLKNPIVVKKQLSKSTEEIDPVIAQQSIYGGLLSGTDDKPCCPLLGQLSPQTRSSIVWAVTIGVAIIYFWNVRD